MNNEQPKDGETVLFCGHTEPEKHHLYYRAKLALGEDAPANVSKFKNWDGREITCRFLIICEECETKCEGDPLSLPLVECTWEGDEPLQFKPLVIH